MFTKGSYSKLAQTIVCYALLIVSLVEACQETCGRSMILFKKYTMCHLETQREICSAFRRRNLQRGFACGACKQSNSDLPAVGQVLDLVDYREMTTLELKISSSDTLSTLWLITNRGKQVPVARSYLGNDWEAYPGRFSKLTFQCDGTSCSTRLPATSRAFQIRYGKYVYQLATFQHSPGRDAEVARFLEQGTFGPTRAEIDAFPSSVAAWMEQQQQLPLSSHRQMFREYWNHRFQMPTIHGVSTHACAAGTRYRNYAFTARDLNRMVEIRTDEIGRKVFLMDGQARTVVNETTLYAGPAANNLIFADGFYPLCHWTGEHIGSNFRLTRNNACQYVENDQGRLGIPRVFFDDVSPPTNPTVTLDGHAIEADNQYFEGGIAQELFVETALDDSVCDEFPEITGKPIYTVVGEYDGEFWIHDPRFNVHGNTVDSPKADSGAVIVELTKNTTVVEYQTQCFSAAMNFLNEDGCFLSQEATGCGEVIADNTKVNLTVANFEKVFDASKGDRLIYAVTGLRQDNATIIPYDAPCYAGSMSRWVPVDDNVCYTSTLGSNTIAEFKALIGGLPGTNKYMRDVLFPSLDSACDIADKDKVNFGVMVDEVCWQNVHRSHLQVYDFSGWVTKHPGGATNILKTATGSGEFVLEFPWHHDMSRWHENFETELVDLGRYGDEVSLTARPEVSNAFESITVSSRVAGSTVVCGSPHEVANRPDFYGSLGRGAFDAATSYNRTSNAYDLERQKGEIWMQIALKGKDQLRQRVAWALSQILVVSPGAIGAWYATENFVTYYDIFVRNAFGNYRDILKEVSFSPAMAEMLSFKNSQSTAYMWQRRARLEYADENFAREVMQLFSIGLTKLNQDGSEALDQAGNPSLTYTNDDITEYARLWTGFQEETRRGNVEQPSRWSGSLIDPMKINPETRDNLPKMGINGKYIGDGVPLCADLPDKHFLKQGATYRLLGNVPKTKLLQEPNEWLSDNEIKRLRLQNSSALYQKLCNKGSGETCQYQAKVVLDNSLECFGVECDIASPRVVEVEAGLYYEYVRIPCVQQAFFDNPQMMTRFWYMFFCGDPRLEAGGVACCSSPSQWGGGVVSQEKFAGERMPLALAETRCEADGLVLCDRPTWDCNNHYCDRNLGRWAGQDCRLKMKINLEGKVSIVHNVTDTRIDVNRIQHSVREDTKTFFRVHWSAPIEEELLDDYSAKCTKLGCTRDSFDNLCLCPVSVSESQVFSLNTPPSREQVLSELHIGAFPPTLYDGSFTTSDLGGGVRMHLKGDSISVDTIYEVVDDFGVKQLRKNVKSIVKLDTDQGSLLSFRNPPHFISITTPEARDAYYETEAGLDQYFYHENTAPFLATRLAQRFGISNPSPRYIEAIATAFREGNYVDTETGTVFGQGLYGDMGAMVAAVLLDREARSVVLDADAAHGAVLEPFLKVVRVMRSLDFQSDDNARFKTLKNDLIDRIGQQAHELPNVFSFFLPEYAPAGAIGEAEFICPECQTMTGPKSIALMNGLFSLLKYGLDSAYGGLGLGRGGWEGHRRYGQTGYATGAVKFQPVKGQSSFDVIDELALLLTSGRLSHDKKAKLVQIYDEAMERDAVQEALINVQQAMLTTPEFHTNALSDNTGPVLPEDDPVEPSSTPYKAVIYVMLDGGVDSHNLLVPHKCERGNDAGIPLDEQYKSERGDLALTNAERSHIIQVDAKWDQPCSQFAIHPAMELLKELYDEGDLTFLANVGVVGEAGMTKKDYRDKTKVQLFAHNAMQRECKTVDPWASAPGTGVLGRLATLLKQKGFKTNSISIDSPSIAVEPEASPLAPIPMIISRYGVSKYDYKPDRETFDMKPPTDELNALGGKYSNIFAKTWSKQLTRGIREAESLKNYIDTAELGPHWPTTEITNTNRGFSMISKLIQTRNLRGADRDFFYVNNGGWDHHSKMKENIQNKFADLNQGLRDLVEELKLQGVWDSTTVVVTSEFSRTINQNSGLGSDHAWGGNYFMMGGAVEGGRILGKYPDDITENGDLNLGRGRIIPTTSWDAIYHGVSQWMGAEDDSELDYCLPNRNRSVGNGFSDLMPKDVLFKSSRRSLRRR